MAMALSSRLGPAGRRRRPLVGGETEEEKESGTRPTVRFGHELRDSDQTLVDTPAGRPWDARVAVQRTRSSFFPDSTDDEVSDVAYQSRIAAPAPPRRMSASAVPAFPVVHIGDVQFPITRSVLWDRRVLAGPFRVSTEDVLPSLRIANNVLKQLHRLAIDAAKTTTPASRLLGYAVADDPVEQPDGQNKARVTLSHLAHRLPQKVGSTYQCVAFHFVAPGTKNDPESFRQTSIEAARSKYESTNSTRGGHALPLDVRGMISLTADRSQAEMNVELEAIVPRLRLQFDLIRSLPMLTTPLAASLLRCEFGRQTLRFGFLTLDRSRKAVPLLHTDPLVLQRPIVGIWVYGINVDDPSNADAMNLSHPYLFQACMRYLSSKLIKERAQVDTRTFLVAVYPGDVCAPLPRFFECQAPQTASSLEDVEGWTHATAHGRCLAGVSVFRADLDFTLDVVEDLSKSSAEGALFTAKNSARELQSTLSVPSIHTQLKSEVRSIKIASKKSGELIAGGSEGLRGHDIRTSQASGTNPAGQENSEVEALRQELARVLRVLSEAQAENARLIAASRNRSTVRSPTESDHENEQISEANMIAGPRSNQPELVLESPDQPSLEDDTRGNDLSCTSSLALSSISQGSNLSGLSSVSSSVVGTRLKNIVSNEGSEQRQQSNASFPFDGYPVDGDKKDESSIEVMIDEDEKVESPFTTPLKSKLEAHQCERDEFEDEFNSDSARMARLLSERLHIPHTPNREEIVHSGALTTLGFSHGSSFSIPKIKYVSENITSDSDEDEEEQIRLIELKYQKRRL